MEISSQLGFFFLSNFHKVFKVNGNSGLGSRTLVPTALCPSQDDLTCLGNHCAHSAQGLCDMRGCPDTCGPWMLQRQPFWSQNNPELVTNNPSNATSEWLYCFCRLCWDKIQVIKHDKTYYMLCAFDTGLHLHCPAWWSLPTVWVLNVTTWNFFFYTAGSY